MSREAQHPPVGYNDAPFKQSFFDITKAQAKPKVEPHGVAEDRDRNPGILVFCHARPYVQALITSHHVAAAQASQEVVNTLIVQADISNSSGAWLVLLCVAGESIRLGLLCGRLLDRHRSFANRAVLPGRHRQHP